MTKPTRIQRQRTKGWTKPDNTVNVARPSKWGNPFEWKRTTDCLSNQVVKSAVVAIFEARLTAEQKAQIRTELRGKNLMCWCKIGEPCHADVLLEIANE